MTYTVRVILLVYWIFLTLMLLLPNPLALLGIERIPGQSALVGVHFILFTLLGGLAFGSRFRRGWIATLVALVAYAILTETLQSLVPERTTELRDFAENLLGVAAAAGVAWLLTRDSRRTATRSEPQRLDVAEP
jgi:VanZ family protein